MQQSNSIRTTTRLVPVVKLVLLPSSISIGQAPIYALHIRNGLAQPYEVFPLDQIQYDKYFKILDSNLDKRIHKFTTKEIDQEANRIKKIYQNKKHGKALDNLIIRNLIRYFQQHLLSLLHAEKTINFYHKIPKLDKKGYLIERCNISIEKVTLHFEISYKEYEKLSIYFLINNQRVSLKEIVRYGFLIYFDACYYFLNVLDVQTLDYLDKQDWAAIYNNVDAFQRLILDRLTNDYRINTIDDHQENIVSVKPSLVVLLSELSNSLLVINPKFRYGDILVECQFEQEKIFLNQGKQVVLRRDLEKETEFLDYLKSLHSNFKQQKDYFFLKFDEAKKQQWFLKVYHQLLRDQVEILGFDLLQQFRYTAYPMEQTMRMKKTVDHLVYFEWEIYFGLQACLLKDVQKMLVNNLQNLLLTDGSIAVFEDDWVRQFGNLIRHGKIIQHNTIAIPIWLCLTSQEIQTTSKVDHILPADWLKKWETWQHSDTTIFEISNELKATLRPYQQKGFEWMQLLSDIHAGGILSDDMGLGKTIQSIAFLLRQLAQYPSSKHIIICPTSLVYNWEKEFEKFAPNVSIYVHAGSNRGLDKYINNHHQVCITSYGVLRSEIELFAVVHWHSVFLDESHHIKNLQAQVSKAVMQLNAHVKFCLTGTPILNNTVDLYAQFKFILPDLLGGFDFFKKYYADSIDKFQSETHAKQLKSLVAPFILKRNKEQVAADLPSKTEITLWCEMDVAQQLAYYELKNQIKANVLTGLNDESINSNAISILAGISKLRQFCAAPQLVINDNKTIESIKLKVLMDEILQLIPQHSVLVFSQYKGMLQLIREKLQEHAIAYYLIDGSTSSQERMQRVEAFQSEESKVNVFLLSLKTGNAGLNLTKADYVFLVDPWWNAAVENQAIDRTHRIGQTKNVMAYRLICKNTIEEKILLLQQQKTEVSEKVVSYEEGFVKQLSVDDLKYLFD